MAETIIMIVGILLSVIQGLIAWILNQISRRLDRIERDVMTNSIAISYIRGQLTDVPNPED